MPTHQDNMRRLRHAMKRAVGVAAAATSVFLLATCDLDKLQGPAKEDEPPINIQIAGDTTVFLAGESAPLSMTAGTSNGPVTLTNVRRQWLSLAPNIATVDSLGVVHGVSLGTASIVGTLLTPELGVPAADTVTLRVRYKGLRITGYATPDSLTGLHQTRTIAVSGTDNTDAPVAAVTATLNAVGLSGTDTVWRREQTNVIRARKNGTATLTATFENMTANLAIKVRQVAKTILFPNPEYVADAVNANRTLPLTVRDVADSAIVAPTLRWRSSDTNQVAIDTITGVLRVKSALATAMITVRADTVIRAQGVRVVQVAASMTKSAGDAQTDTVGHTLTTAPQVTVLDAGNTPIAGVSVTFAPSAGDGSVTGATATTDANGRASVGSWTLGNIARPQTLTAAAGNLVANFSATARSLPAAKLVFTTQPSLTQGGINIAPAVKVALVDTLNNIDATATDNVTLALGNNPTSSTFLGTKTVAAIGGVATFSDVRVTLPGSAYSITATSGTLAAGNSLPFDVYGGATKLGFLTQPSSVTGGTFIAPAVRVAIQDANGATVANSSATVTLNLTTNPGGANFGGTRTVAAVNGIATFSNLTVDVVANGYRMTATSPGLTDVQSDLFNATAVGTPKKLAFSQQPTNVLAGNSITPGVSVAVQDSAGAIVNTASNLVTLTIDPAANPGSSSLSGGNSISVNAVNGIATFSTASLNKTGTGYKLAAASSGLTSTTSATFDVTPGSATKLGFIQPPTHTVAGQTMAPQVTVAVQDANDNTVTTQAPTSVSLSLTGCTGTLSGGGAVNTANGIATFGSLSVAAQVANCRLTAQSAPLANGVSPLFNVVAPTGGAVRLGFVAPPGNIAAGHQNLGTVQIELQDAAGVRVTAGNAVQITLGIGNNPSNGVISGTQTQFTNSGVATFTFISLTRAGNGYTLTASATAFPTRASTAFNVTPGPINRLGFVVPPVSVDAGVSFPEAVKVAIQDEFENTVTTATNPVTMFAQPSGGGGNPELLWYDGPTAHGTFGATQAVTPVNGVATFPSQLRIKQAGTYNISASANNGGSGMGTGFTPVTVSRTAPALLAFTTQPPTTVSSANTFGVDVALQDSVGNTIDNATNSVTLSLTGGDPTAAFNGTLTASMSQGVATFSGLSINKSGTNYRVNATSSGLPTALSNPFEVSASNATKLGWVAQPQNTFQRAPLNPGGQLPQIQVQDPAGNPVTNFNPMMRITIATAPGGVVLRSGGNPITQLDVFPSNGLVTLPSDLTLTGTGSITLRAETPFAGLTSANSSAFIVSAFSTKSKLGFTVEPGADGPAGYLVDMAPSPVVAIQDQYGNTVTDAVDAISLGIETNPGGAALTFTSPGASASGLATFNNVVLDKSGIGYTLVASAAGLTSATSSSFTVNGFGAVQTFAEAESEQVQDMTRSGNFIYTLGFGSPGPIKKIPVNGGPAVLVATAIEGRRILSDANNVYWIEFGSCSPSCDQGAVKKMNIASGAITTIASGLNGAQSGPASMAIDANNVYFATYNVTVNSVVVAFVPIGATGPTAPSVVGTPSSSQFTVPYFTVGGGFIYFFDAPTSTIRRVTTGGANNTTVTSASIAGNSQVGVNYALSGTTLIFTEGSNIKTLANANTVVNGTPVTQVNPSGNPMYSWFLDGNSLYANFNGTFRRYDVANFASFSDIASPLNLNPAFVTPFTDALSAYFYRANGDVTKVPK